MLGLISDIHGNFSALKAVLKKLDDLEITNIVSLGDIAGYYAQINECCDELRIRKIKNLMGNHDWYLSTGAPCPRSRSANQCLEYQRTIIREDNLQWLSQSLLKLKVGSLNLIHGGWNNPLDEYLSPSLSYFTSLRGENFASGHSHVQKIWQGKGKSYCNPGSVGQPRDGDPRAAFATWDGEKFELMRVEYDIDEVSTVMKNAGFSEYFYENLQSGTRIGGGISQI